MNKTLQKFLALFLIVGVVSFAVPTFAQSTDVADIQAEILMFQHIISYLQVQMALLQAELPAPVSTGNSSDDTVLGSISPSPSAQVVLVPTTLQVSSPTHEFPQDGVDMPEACGGGGQVEFNGAVYDQFGNEMPNQTVTVTNDQEGINQTRIPERGLQPPSTIYYELNEYTLNLSSTTEVFHFQAGSLHQDIEIRVLQPFNLATDSCTH